MSFFRRSNHFSCMTAYKASTLILVTREDPESGNSKNYVPLWILSWTYKDVKSDFHEKFETRGIRKKCIIQ